MYEKVEGFNVTGKELKEFRIAAGLTQQALGNMVGISRRAIAKYEAGEIDLGQIEVKTAIKLASVLGVPIKRFLDEQNGKDDEIEKNC